MPELLAPLLHVGSHIRHLLLMRTNALLAIAHDHSEPMPARSIRVNGVQPNYLDLFA